MYMWILALRLFAKSVECATNSNEELQFVPSLPAGKPYSLTNEEDAWSLKGLSDIANGIALTLRSHPPYGEIFVFLLTFKKWKYSRAGLF